MEELERINPARTIIEQYVSNEFLILVQSKNLEEKMEQYNPALSPTAMKNCCGTREREMSRCNLEMTINGEHGIGDFYMHKRVTAFTTFKRRQVGT